MYIKIEFINLGIVTISIKILEFNFGKSVHDNYKWGKIIIVGIGFQPLAWKKPSPLSCQALPPPPPIEPTNWPSPPPLLVNLSLYIGFLRCPPKTWMDLFINMRQACGHWKIGKNTDSVTKWSFLMLQSLKCQKLCILSIYKC